MPQPLQWRLLQKESDERRPQTAVREIQDRPMSSEPGNDCPQPPLSSGAWWVFGSLAVTASMFVISAYSDLFNNASIFVALIMTGFCGGGSVAALRRRDSLNVRIGIAGALWVVLVVCFVAAQAFGLTNL